MTQQLSDENRARMAEVLRETPLEAIKRLVNEIEHPEPAYEPWIPAPSQPAVQADAVKLPPCPQSSINASYCLCFQCENNPNRLT